VGIEPGRGPQPATVLHVPVEKTFSRNLLLRPAKRQGTLQLFSLPSIEAILTIGWPALQGNFAEKIAASYNSRLTRKDRA
jgi:hypothetical protein